MSSFTHDVLVAPRPPVSPYVQRSNGNVLIRPVDGECDLLALHRLNPERYPHLLESVARGTLRSRYDILFAFPGDSLHVANGDRQDFLRSLDAWWREERIAPDKACPLPFGGGWFLYLGYELAAQIEPRLCLPCVGWG